LEAPGDWTISVRDNATGLPPASAERVFQMFQRLHSRNQCLGTGMDLDIYRKIVERHGGRIWVNSVPGTGATFHFTVPKHMAAPKRSSLQTEPRGFADAQSVLFQETQPVPYDLPLTSPSFRQNGICCCCPGQRNGKESPNNTQTHLVIINPVRHPAKAGFARISLGASAVTY
jgi:hypothetical protein